MTTHTEINKHIAREGQKEFQFDFQAEDMENLRVFLNGEEIEPGQDFQAELEAEGGTITLHNAAQEEDEILIEPALELARMSVSLAQGSFLGSAVPKAGKTLALAAKGMRQLARGAVNAAKRVLPELIQAGKKLKSGISANFTQVAPGGIRPDDERLTKSTQQRLKQQMRKFARYTPREAPS